MQKNTERFSKVTQRELTGLYIPLYDCSGFEPIIPSEEPLTVDTFGIVKDGKTYTADDFRWYKEDGSDRDLRYDDSDDCFEGDNLPDEVFCLLNTAICLKFAKKYLHNAFRILDGTDIAEKKQAIDKAVENFYKATDNIEKLQIARDALNELSMGSHCKFEKASEVIAEVLMEIEERRN